MWHYNHHKTDITNTQEHRSFMSINLHSALREVADCLTDWLNTHHLQVMSPSSSWLITLLVTILQTQPREGHGSCSTTTSAERVTSVPSSSQQWERRDESLDSPLPTQEREASDDRPGVYLSFREGSMHPAVWAQESLLRGIKFVGLKVIFGVMSVVGGGGCY